MNNQEYDLAPVWRAILDVYREFAKVCEKHHLRFYAAYGTALGAVRHGGFIPWDDDFDVFMPQDDYDKFMAEAWKDLPNWLKPINWNNSSSFGFRFGKVQDVRVDLAERISERSGHPLSEGIYIDLFPLNGVHGRGPWGRLWSLLFRLRKAYVRRGRPVTLKAKVVWMLGAMSGVMFPSVSSKEDVRSLDEKFARCDTFDGSSLVGYYLADWCRFNFMCPKALFEDIEWYPFCDVKVPMPRDFDSYLKAEFGDYMKLPPVEQRKFTHRNCPPAPWRFGPDKE